MQQMWQYRAQQTYMLIINKLSFILCLLHKIIITLINMTVNSPYYLYFLSSNLATAPRQTC